MHFIICLSHVSIYGPLAVTICNHVSQATHSQPANFLRPDTFIRVWHQPLQLLQVCFNSVYHMPPMLPSLWILLLHWKRKCRFGNVFRKFFCNLKVVKESVCITRVDGLIKLVSIFLTRICFRVPWLVLVFEFIAIFYFPAYFPTPESWPSGCLCLAFITYFAVQVQMFLAPVLPFSRSGLLFVSLHPSDPHVCPGFIVMSFIYDGSLWHWAHWQRGTSRDPGQTQFPAPTCTCSSKL